MKIEYTFEELLAMESSENKKRIQEKSERLKEDYLLTQIRNDLNMSQTELAKALGISRPAVSKMEKMKQNIGILTLKKYIEALGGQLSLQIRMPTGDLRSYFV